MVSHYLLHNVSVRNVVSGGGGEGVDVVVDSSKPVVGLASFADHLHGVCTLAGKTNKQKECGPVTRPELNQQTLGEQALDPLAYSAPHRHVAQ